MANGKTEGYGIYLAPTASASLGYARGINKMFMCRGTLLSSSQNSCLFLEKCDFSDNRSNFKRK